MTSEHTIEHGVENSRKSKVEKVFDEYAKGHQVNDRILKKTRSKHYYSSRATANRTC
jgi:hypothetical protein